jgi:Carboxypeptidase regulatory-like domain
MFNLDREHLAIRLFAVMLAVAGAGLASTAAWAQAQGENASIIGVVTDKSGAVIPNATVTITSPALQVPELTAKTDADGNYKFVVLPAPGVYRLTFKAAGFGTIVEPGITLTVGFTAKVDTVLPVGNTSTQVVVTGAGPVINTISTAVTSTLQGETLSQVPKPLGMQDILSLAAGVSLAGAPDVGDSNLAVDEAVQTDGIGVTGSDTDTLQPTLRIDGINSLTAHESDGRVYLDSLAIAESELKTSGNNADVGLPGVAEEAVMKSGGNTFHGDAQGDFERPGFQSNNITAAEAAPPNNLKFGNPLVGDAYYDYAADLGGRILRDKLWFYGGLDKQLINEGQANFHGGPDATGCWTCADAPSADLLSDLPQYDGRFDYQLSTSTRLSFSELYATKLLNNQSGTPTIPLPAAQYELQPGKTWIAQANTVIGPRMVLVGGFGYAGYDVNYEPEPVSQIGQFGFTKGAEFAGSPSEEELTDKLYTGPYPTLFNDKPQNRYEMPISLTYIPANPHLGGHHQFAFGTDDTWESSGSRLKPTTMRAATIYCSSKTARQTRLPFITSPFRLRSAT